MPAGTSVRSSPDSSLAATYRPWAPVSLSNRATTACIAVWSAPVHGPRTVKESPARSPAADVEADGVGEDVRPAPAVDEACVQALSRPAASTADAASARARWC